MKRFTCLAALVLIAGLVSCHEEETTTTVQANSDPTIQLQFLNTWTDAPTEYTYPATYSTRYIVPNLANALDSAGALPPDTFTAVDIASFEDDDVKYYGGVLAPNGKIYFVPSYADNVGVFTPGSAAPVYDVDGDIPLSWSALLGPRYNKY